MYRSNVFEQLRRVLLVALLACATGAGVAATTKGPDAGAYTGTDSTTYSFVDISGASGGIGILAGTDDGTVALTLPFAFQFYGQPRSLVCVSSNGALYFVTAESACAGLNDFANTDLTSVATINDLPAVLPLWTDLTFQVAGAGSVFYQTLGAAGARKFVVQWNNAYPQGSPNPVTFQLILSESGNTVLFQYKTVDLGGGNPASKGALATIGIRNTQALTNQQQIAWSFGAPVIADNTAVLFSATALFGDVNGDHVVNCADMAAMRAAFGKRRGQVGYTAAADVNNDGIVSILDLAMVSRGLPAGIRCP